MSDEVSRKTLAILVLVVLVVSVLGTWFMMSGSNVVITRGKGNTQASAKLSIDSSNLQGNEDKVVGNVILEIH